jgi:uncharacterized protein
MSHSNQTQTEPRAKNTGSLSPSPKTSPTLSREAKPSEIPCDVVSHRPPGHHVQHALLIFAVGIIFGIILTQSQAISWYRIQEMFRFGSVHMFGIIGSALAVGLMVTALIRRRGLTDFYRVPIELTDKAPGWRRYLFGGILFGLGWALAGVCPGPMFVLIGNDTVSALIALAAAMLGTFAYGLVRRHLPH